MNLFYTGTEGQAKEFAKEMVASGLVAQIRNLEGNLGYDSEEKTYLGNYINLKESEEVLTGLSLNKNKLTQLNISGNNFSDTSELKKLKWNSYTE